MVTDMHDSLTAPVETASPVAAAVAPLDLPALDGERQALAERLALLIETAAEAPATFAVAIEHASHPGPWFSGEDGVAVRVDRLDGRAAALHAERLDATVAALDRVEPYLDWIEAQTGWVIEPDRVAPPPADALLFRVDVGGPDAGITFAIAVPVDRAATVHADPLLPGLRMASAHLPCTVRATAAFLSVEDANALTPGDLLILQPAPWRAVLTAGPLDDTQVVFDPGTGRVEQGGRMAGEMGQEEAAEQLRRFQVPVELALAAGSATLAELAALREGGTLPLGPVTAGLSVTLSVGGRALGTGELVRLGDRFAVVVDRLAAVVEAIPPADENAG